MDIEEIRRLLSRLQVILNSQGDKNWIRGITAALQALDEDRGVERARSIYVSMSQGSGSFSDYNVWIDDFDLRRKANEELDNIREALWRAFDP